MLKPQLQFWSIPNPINEHHGRKVTVLKETSPIKRHLVREQPLLRDYLNVLNFNLESITLLNLREYRITKQSQSCYNHWHKSLAHLPPFPHAMLQSAMLYGAWRPISLFSAFKFLNNIERWEGETDLKTPLCQQFVSD